MPRELSADEEPRAAGDNETARAELPETEDADVEAPGSAALEDVVERFIAKYVHPRRSEFRTAERLPSVTELLGAALSRRRIQVQEITAVRWAFRFADTVIGGYSGGLTTLVSAHARRVLADEKTLRKHFQLMEIPTPERDAGASTERAGLVLRGFVVGRQLVSLLAIVPPYEYDDAVSGPAAVRLTPGGGWDVAKGQGPELIAVDVTERVSEEVSSLAVDAVRAIPGLSAAEVELEVASLDSAQSAVVHRVDESADLLPHHMPTLGPGRDVADAIAEQILISAAL